jgi:hypothetical protein
VPSLGLGEYVSQDVSIVTVAQIVGLPADASDRGHHTTPRYATHWDTIQCSPSPSV